MASNELGFDLDISWRNVETNEPITFKIDGERFNTSNRTLKLCSNAKYKINLSSRPPIEFQYMHLAGSDLTLQSLNPKDGQYTTEWNTAGIDPSKQASRMDLHLTLQGPRGTMKKILQAKFYKKGDSHADWGHKLNSLNWRCVGDALGNIAVVNETIK